MRSSYAIPLAGCHSDLPTPLLALPANASTRLTMHLPPPEPMLPQPAQRGLGPSLCPIPTPGVAGETGRYGPDCLLLFYSALLLPMACYFALLQLCTFVFASCHSLDQLMGLQLLPRLTNLDCQAVTDDDRTTTSACTPATFAVSPGFERRAASRSPVLSSP